MMLATFSYQRTLFTADSWKSSDPDVLARALERLGQRNRVLERHARARTDREVHGAERVPEQHHVVVAPARVAHDARAHPLRLVGQERLAAEVLAEHLGAVPRALLVAH